MLRVEPFAVMARLESAYDGGTRGRRGTFRDQLANAAKLQDTERVRVHFNAPVPRNPA
jgi:hypothetical protein